MSFEGSRGLRRAGSGRTFTLITGVLTIAVAVVVAGCTVSGGADSGDMLETTATSIAVTTQVPAVGLDELEWRRIPHDDAVFGGEGSQGMTSVATGGSVYVAVGYDSSGGDEDAALWYSSDGTTWSRIPHDETTFGGDGRQSIESVAADGYGFVAVGQDYLGNEWGAAVWRSTDGKSWSRLPHDEAAFGGGGWQVMYSVAVLGSETIAVGGDWSGGDEDAAVWHSSDGTTWTRIPHDEAVFGGSNDQSAWSVAASQSAFVAVGWDLSSGDEDAAVWHSSDGTTWSRIPHDEAVFGGDNDQAMWSVVATESGFYAVGRDWSGGDEDAAVWHSSDGTTWTRIPHDEAVFGGDNDQAMWSLVATESGFYAVGADRSGEDQDAAAWHSSDGTTWTRVPHDEAIFGGSEGQLMNAVAATATRVVAVGAEGWPDNAIASVWTTDS